MRERAQGFGVNVGGALALDAPTAWMLCDNVEQLASDAEMLHLDGLGGN